MTAGPGLDAPGDVRREDAFDEGALADFIARAFPGTGGASTVSVSQFGAGHSNLTYLVAVGGREMVLRRAPRGADVKSAHDMRREFDVLSALAPLYSKAPKAFAFCEEAGVIGAPFYLMERVKGVILRDQRPPAGVDLPPPRMRALSEALVDELAALHALDVSSGPLAALGKPEGYAVRQVSGWTQRWIRAKTEDVPALDTAAAWLAGRVPAASRPALVHNDFKYDNLVLDAEDPARIVAVLDWEMATLGDPVLDVGTTLGYWIDPDDAPEVRALPFGPTLIPGNLSREEVAARWMERTGRPDADVLFAYVFGLFKIAVIAQQIYKRYALGHSRDPRFAALIHGVRILGRQAARALERGRIS
ncbi:MAG TPA: phosphotransferase family protein [Thermoanaerobaculia bacterium]|jgi:aminoglycoside phosphotransferase (APT) family kinase protein